MTLYRVLTTACAAIFAILSAAGTAWAETRLVRSGDNLQSALNLAQPGDVIMLEAGATFRGNFTLPVKGGATAITIRSSAPDEALPGSGMRITPAFSALLPKIQSPNTAPALKTAAGSHHWRLQFLEFGANQYGFGEIIQIGDGSSAQTQLSQVPYEIIVDRVYIHGDPTIGQKRGIALNARAVTIRESYISDIKFVGQDSQAIGGWNGPGPYLIENNYLEAAGENVLLGGADPAIPDLVTEDVIVRYNHLFKPLAWRGLAWQVKNLFEIKNARRVLIEYNVFENNWAAAQPGYAILLTPRNQDGGCPWCVVADVTFQYNIVRNVGGGINLTGYDNLNVSAQTSRILISNNLFYGVTKTMGGTGWFLLIGSQPRNVVVDHNTVDADGTTFVYAHGGSAADPEEMLGIQITNNAARHGSYGINGANVSYGLSAINAYFPGSTVRGNWLAGGTASRYPSGNLFGGVFSAAFVNQAAGDYQPAAGSILVGAATDGTNIGADVRTLFIRAARVVEGVAGARPPAPSHLRVISR
jgi:hypothetical protein